MRSALDRSMGHRAEGSSPSLRRLVPTAAATRSRVLWATELDAILERNRTPQNIVHCADLEREMCATLPIALAGPRPSERAPAVGCAREAPCGACAELRKELAATRGRCRDQQSIISHLLLKLAGAGATAPEIGMFSAVGEEPSEHPQLKIALLQRMLEDFERSWHFASTALEPTSDMLECQEVLGSGTYGTVASAWCGALGKRFAVKIPSSEEGAHEALRREAETLLKITTHENIVSMTAIHESSASISVAMEQGSWDMLEATRNGKHSTWELCNFMTGVAKGVQHMHDNGVVHSDLKFGNVIIFQLSNDSFIAKIADFGLAYETGETKPYRTGTHGTMPPENYLRSVVADPAQDVFALGAMVIQLMVHPELYRHDMFAHEMLWTPRDRELMDGMAENEKQAYLVNLSFGTMVDTSDTGFGATIVQPKNLQPLPPSILGIACTMMRSMVCPHSTKRPNMGVVITFLKLIAIGLRQMAQASGAVLETETKEAQEDEGKDSGEGDSTVSAEVASSGGEEPQSQDGGTSVKALCQMAQASGAVLETGTKQAEEDEGKDSGEGDSTVSAEVASSGGEEPQSQDGGTSVEASQSSDDLDGLREKDPSLPVSDVLGVDWPNYSPMKPAVISEEDIEELQSLPTGGEENGDAIAETPIPAVIISTMYGSFFHGTGPFPVATTQEGGAGGLGWGLGGSGSFFCNSYAGLGDYPDCPPLTRPDRAPASHNASFSVFAAATPWEVVG